MNERGGPSRARVQATATPKVVQIVTPVRAELHKAMRVRAAEEGTTIRVLVIRGLRAIGLPVLPDDEEDRRSARGNRRSVAGGKRSSAAGRKAP